MIELRESNYINFEICNSTVGYKQNKCLKRKKKKKQQQRPHQQQDSSKHTGTFSPHTVRPWPINNLRTFLLIWFV